MISDTPNPPYYAVVFTSLRSDIDNDYDTTSKQMLELAQMENGFLGIETARNEIGITVSYWKSLEDIKNWKNQIEHKMAQEKGRKEWYKKYKVRICKVERDYGFNL